MKLDWEIIDVVETLKGDWQVVEVEAYDEEGNHYTASCETYISNPVIITDNIRDIEKNGKS